MGEGERKGEGEPGCGITNILAVADAAAVSHHPREQQCSSHLSRREGGTLRGGDDCRMYRTGGATATLIMSENERDAREESVATHGQVTLHTRGSHRHWLGSAEHRQGVKGRNLSRTPALSDYCVTWWWWAAEGQGGCCLPDVRVLQDRPETLLQCSSLQTSNTG